jgi:hypothetical protein
MRAPHVCARTVSSTPTRPCGVGRVCRAFPRQQHDIRDVPAYGAHGNGARLRGIPSQATAWLGPPLFAEHRLPRHHNRHISSRCCRGNTRHTRCRLRVFSCLIRRRDSRRRVITLTQTWSTFELLAQAPAESRAHYVRAIRRALRGKDDAVREKNARV